MTFFTADYEEPLRLTKYLKPDVGATKFRILTSPISGWKDWDKAKNKPVRYNQKQEPKPLSPEKKPSMFWAMVVWNYNTETIQIYEITQSTIWSPIKTFSADPHIGAPFHYDITLYKTGSTKEQTKYAVSPGSPTPLEQRIKNEFLACPVNLKALYVGADPFLDVNEQTRTLGFWEQKKSADIDLEDLPPSFLSAQQAAELGNLIQIHIGPVDALWMKNFLQACKISKLQDLPADRYSWAKRQIERKIEELKKTEFSADDIPF